MQKERDFNNEVAETRKLVIEREHGALLVWGIAAAAIGILIYLLQTLTAVSCGWLWLALPVIAVPLHSYVDKKNDKHEKMTTLYDRLSSISKVSIAMIAIVAFLTIPFSYNSYFCIMLILSIWCALSGFMLNYKRLCQLSIGGLALATALIVMQNTPYILPIFVAGLSITLIAPGLEMYKRSVSHNFS